MKTHFIYFFTAVLLSVYGKAQSYSWGGRFGGDGEDVVKKMHVDSAGTSYTTGYFTHDADFDISERIFMLTAGEDYDAFVQKTDKNGQLIWAKKFGGISYDYGTDVTTDKDGNVYLTGVYQESGDFDPGEGEFILTSSGGYDIFVVKLDAAGNFIWAKSIGGAEYEETSAIGTDELGNIYLTGYFDGTTDFDPSDSEFNLTTKGWDDGFVTKLSSDGELLWAKQFGGDDFDLALDMKVLPSGELFLTGNFAGTADFDPNPNTIENITTSSYSAFLLHLNNQGEFLSVTKIGESTDRINPMSVDVDIEGVAYIAGYFGGDFSLGLVNGVETTLSANDFYNSFSLKINHDGKFKWANQLTGTAGNVAYAIAVNSKKQVLISGYYGGTMNVGPTDLTNQTENSMESFLTKIDSQGHFIKAYRFGGVNFVDNCGMGIDFQNNIYLSGSFENGVDLNPDADHDIVSNSAGFRDNFLIKMSDSLLDLHTSENVKNNLVVYPNPTFSKITFNFKESVVGKSYEIADYSGKIVMRGKFNAIQQVDLTNLPNGVYLFKSGLSVTKVIKK